MWGKNSESRSLDHRTKAPMIAPLSVVKNAIFRSETLGLDLASGASDGHLPVLDSGILARSAELGPVSQVSLEVDDELVGVGGVSVVGSSNPFQEAVQLIRDHPHRPLALSFLSHSSTPGPYSVTYSRPGGLGLNLCSHKDDPALPQDDDDDEVAHASNPKGFPVVDESSVPQEAAATTTSKDEAAAAREEEEEGSWPRSGDVLVAVAGALLKANPSEKLAEAAALIRSHPHRPLVLTFQPRTVPIRPLQTQQQQLQTQTNEVEAPAPPPPLPAPPSLLPPAAAAAAAAPAPSEALMMSHRISQSKLRTQQRQSGGGGGGRGKGSFGGGSNAARKGSSSSSSSGCVMELTSSGSGVAVGSGPAVIKNSLHDFSDFTNGDDSIAHDGGGDLDHGGGDYGDGGGKGGGGGWSDGGDLEAAGTGAGAGAHFIDEWTTSVAAESAESAEGAQLSNRLEKIASCLTLSAHGSGAAGAGGEGGRAGRAGGNSNSNGKLQPPHQGFEQLSDFFRTLDRGLPFVRLTQDGKTRSATVRMSPSRDSIVFTGSRGAKVYLPFSALRLVTAPFAPAPTNRAKNQDRTSPSSSSPSSDSNSNSGSNSGSGSGSSSHPFEALDPNTQALAKQLLRKPHSSSSSSSGHPDLAPLSLLLVFEVAPSPSFELELSRGVAAGTSVVVGGESASRQSCACLEVAQQCLNLRVKQGKQLQAEAQQQEAAVEGDYFTTVLDVTDDSDDDDDDDEGGESENHLPVEVASLGEVSGLEDCLTALEPISVQGRQRKNTRSLSFVAMASSASNALQRNLSIGGAASSSSSAAGGNSATSPLQLQHSKGVLVLACDSLEALEVALAGFRLAAAHHKHHLVRDEEGELRGSVVGGGLAVNKGGGGGGGGGGRNSSSGAVAAKYKGFAGQFGVWVRKLCFAQHSGTHHGARFHTGVDCEVAFSESYRMEVEISVPGPNPRLPWLGATKTVQSVPLPNRAFQEHMYLRATIVRYDQDAKTYELKYRDGPYLGSEEPDGAKLFAMPEKDRVKYGGLQKGQKGQGSGKEGASTKATASFLLRGVKPAFLSVDLNSNFGSHKPWFVAGIGLLQVFFFFFWLATGDVTYPTDNDGGGSSSSSSSGGEGVREDDGRLDDDNFSSGGGGSGGGGDDGGGGGGGQTVSAYSPVSGAEWAWMEVVSKWPECETRQSEAWRFFSYQLVHSGLFHLFFNVLVQSLFGLPLELVHGSLRVGLVYEAGVGFGALCFVLWDGGYYTLVGASGGVYSIFGMHLAETWLTWSLNHRGVLSRWLRVFAVSAVLTVDVGLTVTSSTHGTTSLPAHLGGLAMGFLGGLLALDTLETTSFHRRVVRPAASVLAVGLPLLLAVAYAGSGTFPPTALDGQDSEPCCWQLLHCPSVPRSDFGSAFVCDEYSLYPRGAFNDDAPPLNSCSDFENTITRAK